MAELLFHRQTSRVEYLSGRHLASQNCEATIDQITRLDWPADDCYAQGRVGLGEASRVACNGLGFDSSTSGPDWRFWFRKLNQLHCNFGVAVEYDHRDGERVIPYCKPQRQHAGPATGSTRAVRGGSWHVTSGSWRSAVRKPYDADYRGISIGFRLAMAVEP